MPLKTYPNIIYGVSDPEFVGKIPVRTEIEVLSADESKNDIHDQVVITDSDEILKKGPIGFRVFERIGVAVINPRGVTAGKKSVIVGK